MSERYSRQTLFPKIGSAGQERLFKARILLIGCGALGASHAEMLARAGVGKLRIVDRDFVELTNLQRQTLFKEADAVERLPKAVAAKTRIGEINSEVKVEAIISDVNHSNIEELVTGCDVVLDGTDNFQVRYIANDACVKLGVPWVYGAAVSSYGTTMTIRPGVTPCLRCIFEDVPDVGSSPTCDTAGVIMPIIASISAVQVTEAIKLIVGDLEALHGSLMQVDIWDSEWRSIRLAGPNPNCKTCGQHDFEFLDAESVEIAAILCGRDAVQISPPRPVALDLDALSQKLRNVGSEIKQNEYLLRMLVDEFEITVFRDGRAIIRGTDDQTAARALYARYIGN